MTQQHNQRIINLGQVRSNTEIQGWFNIENKCDTSHQQNKREEKKYMISSTNAEKAFSKIKIIFMLKALNKLRVEVYYLNMLKSRMEIPLLTLYSMMKD
jgi:hypothetical protein